MGSSHSSSRSVPVGPMRLFRMAGTCDAKGKMMIQARNTQGGPIYAGCYAFVCSDRSEYMNNVTVTTIDINGALAEEQTIHRSKDGHPYIKTRVALPGQPATCNGLQLDCTIKPDKPYFIEVWYHPYAKEL